MGGLTDILNTARDALAAQSFGLNVTGQNVANLNTPEYVRREALLETQVFGDRSYGSVHATGLRRAADQYLQQRYLGATGMSSYASARDDLLGSVEQVFNDPVGLGIGDALNQLFSSFTAVANNPNDVVARTELLQRASVLIEQINGTGESLANYQANLLSQAQGVATQVNSETAKIAELSGKIKLAENLGQDAADLRDQRDQRLKALSELVDVRTFSNDQGELVVQGAGTTLVEGSIARQLGIDLAPGGTIQVQAGKAGGAMTDVTQFVSGGKLAAIMQVRDVDTANIRTSFDQFVYDIATEINNVHAAGYALDGSTGNNFFSALGAAPDASRLLTLDAALVGQPTLVAASLSAASVPGDGGNALALARLRDALLTNGGTRSPAAGYAALVGDVASRKSEAASTRATREAIAVQTTAMKESTSGVSLDEEMVNLSKFQRAYQAASRVLTTADEMIQELLARVGR